MAILLYILQVCVTWHEHSVWKNNKRTTHRHTNSYMNINLAQSDVDEVNWHITITIEKCSWSKCIGLHEHDNVWIVHNSILMQLCLQLDTVMYMTNTMFDGFRWLTDVFIVNIHEKRARTKTSTLYMLIRFVCTVFRGISAIYMYVFCVYMCPRHVQNTHFGGAISFPLFQDLRNSVW